MLTLRCIALQAASIDLELRPTSVGIMLLLWRSNLLRSHARSVCMPCRSDAPNMPGDRCAGCCAENARIVLLRSCCARRLMLCLAAMAADLDYEMLPASFYANVSPK